MSEAPGLTPSVLASLVHLPRNSGGGKMSSAAFSSPALAGEAREAKPRAEGVSLRGMAHA
jgi:hypothetical protein